MKKIVVMLCITLFCLVQSVYANQSNPRVQLKTNHGIITLELDPQSASKTVENFLRYARDGFYNGTIFHRVIKGFMIQGGGLTPDMREKPTRASITNEADNGLKNNRGTIAMARKADPHSASSQFFINTSDNGFLDHKGKNSAGWGYCVFGKIVGGMNVVDTIENQGTTSKSGYDDVPLFQVIIEQAVVEK
ncbi:MAG: Peptidyl-prolyl cis-trans isomerase PpiB [Candidatus Jettenia ecosi]|uniref:Peptidyl-prolyl cis-trans isomerase n=1 Tax=Candidatus Jettenia ecosi TaxID=2494326 RepID=A0A533Q5U6_9BACT|nr:MAG: Peptidyl-prolyl cis-trans isomerase PpiB [Candidatus Jettenia ecosi]